MITPDSIISQAKSLGLSSMGGDHLLLDMEVLPSSENPLSSHETDAGGDGLDPISYLESSRCPYCREGEGVVEDSPA